MIDRAELARAMNDYEEKTGADPWPVQNPGTHRIDCMHVGYIADRYDAALANPPVTASLVTVVRCKLDGRLNGCPDHFHLGPAFEETIEPGSTTQGMT